ncbi:MAG TPA: hypothetical protein VGF31_12590 [Myxococcaceae bacterium]
MGREARCSCRWAEGEGEVKALLETEALVLRGALRRSIPRKDISGARVVGDALRLGVGAEELSLALGAKAASSWLAALRAGPPPLAKKLGIGPGTRVRVVGRLDAPELEEAIAGAVRTSGSMADLILARVSDERSARRAADALRTARGAALWVVFTKGKDSPFGEAAVRAVLRGGGFTDTKVASVSPTLTAARYQRLVR